MGKLYILKNSNNCVILFCFDFQAGAWISTFLWLAVFLVGFLSMYRAGKIPFLQSGAPASGTSDGNSAPPKMETPPSNPDDMPKY